MRKASFTSGEREQILLDIASIQSHMKVLNGETGDLRDLTETNAKNMATMNITLSTVKNDVGWLKQYFWIITTSSVSAVIVGVINLLTKN